MAFSSNPTLSPDQHVVLRDYQHASKLFTVDQFRLAPKHSFLFHVAFSINSTALQSIDLIQRHSTEIGMLVKSCDLPSFSLTSETLNQYNRKKVVTTTHKFNEISMKFHDDNMGLINQMWQNYYTYYFADSKAAKVSGAYSRNATKSSDFIVSPYGLDNKSTDPFFNSIKIYQMARHEFVCYTLINPVITSWNHNKVSYSENSVHDFDMKLQYEAVDYSVGTVSEGLPEGFGAEHYDTTASPLQGVTSTTSPSFAQNLNLSNVATDRKSVV